MYLVDAYKGEPFVASDQGLDAAKDRSLNLDAHPYDNEYVKQPPRQAGDAKKILRKKAQADRAKTQVAAKVDLELQNKGRLTIYEKRAIEFEQIY